MVGGRRPGTAMQTVDPKRQAKLARDAERVKNKMRAANTRNTELIRQMSKEDQANLTPKQERDMYLFYPEDYFKRSGYPMNGRPQDYYNDEGVTLKRNAEKKINMDEYKRFNEDINQ